MTDHEDRIDNHRVDDGRGQGLSPSQVLATLVHGAPTDDDIAMLMELRVGLRAHPAGPASVVEGPVVGPLDPQTEVLLDRCARQRLRRRFDMRPLPAQMPSTATDPTRSVDLSDIATIDGHLGGGDLRAGDRFDGDDPASEQI